jgi:hypothetical protein
MCFSSHVHVRVNRNGNGKNVVLQCWSYFSNCNKYQVGMEDVKGTSKVCA